MSSLCRLIKSTREAYVEKMTHLVGQFEVGESYEIVYPAACDGSVERLVGQFVSFRVQSRPGRQFDRAEEVVPYTLTPGDLCLEFEDAGKKREVEWGYVCGYEEEDSQVHIRRLRATGGAM